MLLFSLSVIVHNYTSMSLIIHRYKGPAYVMRHTGVTPQLADFAMSLLHNATLTVSQQCARCCTHACTSCCNTFTLLYVVLILIKQAVIVGANPAVLFIGFS